MKHFIYIVRCKDATLYTGYTTDIPRRILEHNTRLLGARYTKGRAPVVLIYSEQFDTRGEALAREWQIKQLSRAQKIALSKTCT